MMGQKNGKKRSRLILTLVCTILVVAAVGVSFGVGNFLVTYAIGRTGGGGNRQVALKVDETAVAKTSESRQENAAAQKALTMAFYENVPEQAVSIQSADGLRLNAAWYEQADSHQWAILVHGYRSNHLGMLGYAQRYHDAGWQVLAPDLRACGESEGDYVGMGWPDRLDMLRWIDWILAKDPEARIVMHGVSMGGATVMMTAGEKTPDAVVAFVEDCGYTSVWDIFASELGLRFHLPTFPVLNTASLLSGIRAGYDFESASSLAQIAKCEKPMLMIHGDQDNFVPFSMLQLLYDAKPGTNKQMIAVPGAGHGMASSVMGDEYWNSVFAFIQAYMD